VGLVGLAGFGLVKGCTSAVRQPSYSVSTSEAPASQARRSHRQASSSSRKRTAAATPLTTAASPAETPARQPVSALDRKVIELSKSALTNGTSDSSGRKWRIKQDRIVIELRSDTAKGSTTWNRLKIDLDRDKNWDEAWDLKPGKPIKRRIAPADDENYTVTYDLQGETWVKRDK
jgi:hypothetical protein